MKIDNQNIDIQPLVSIGMAVYNGEKTIELAIESLINQSYNNLEIIINDDCSNDKTIQICNKFSEDKRINIYSNKKNIGTFNNINKVFKMSKGKYFLWADQDDLRDKDYIMKAVKELENDPLAVLCHSHTAVFLNEKKNIMHINKLNEVKNLFFLPTRYWKLLRQYNDTLACSLFRTDSLKKTSLWLPINGSSNNLIFELALQGHFLEIPEKLFFYSGQALSNKANVRNELLKLAHVKAGFFYSPAITLSYYQAKKILISKINIYYKIILLFLLFYNFFLTNLSKLIFRTFDLIFQNNIPKFIFNICKILMPENKDIEYIVKPEENPNYYPPFYPYRKV